MNKPSPPKFRTLDDQLVIMADAIRTLQELVRQHHAAIKTITKLLEDQTDAHPPL